MNSKNQHMTRRDFIGTGSALGAGALLASSPFGLAMAGQKKKRLVLVGTGVRGSTVTQPWGSKSCTTIEAPSSGRTMQERSPMGRSSCSQAAGSHVGGG